MKKKTALFIGRFQPLHYGHLHAIRRARRKYNVIVLIGSINKKDEKNPFSYPQRKDMISSLFPNIKIIGIKDTTDSAWTKKIKKLKFDVVISGNARVWKCLKGCAIEIPKFSNPKRYNGTKIRKLLAHGKSVDGLVPKKIVKITQKKRS
ncbi:MAG: adenylyltransferase/cytidyltransferase family protein [Candidatus Aenigmarchaeota archaeon]|nr:adenylyltransferase/cytidyltransferase family protein [Candidatus Aenigmarchaeota archaeon]